MEINTFTLTTADHHHNIFAVGMSITHPDGQQEVITYHRNPVNGHSTFATYDTPEKALTRSNMVVPVKLEWHNHTNKPTKT